MKLTYELIRPLIVEEYEGDKFLMHVSFKAGNSPKVVQSSGAISRQYGALSSQAKSLVRDSAVDYLHEMARGLVRGILGTGRMGEAGRRVTERVIHENKRKLRMTKDDKRAAVVEAFRRVANQFHYDNINNRWLLVEGLSEFSEKMTNLSLDDPYDKEVLARMLMELAEADGEVTADERALLSEHLPQSYRTLNELSLGDSLSRVELEKTSVKNREGMFMLAATMILIDREVTPGEKRRLIEFADYFGFTTGKVNDLVRMAKTYILEQAILSPDITRAELFELADGIKLPRDEAERVLVSMKKRSYV